MKIKNIDHTKITKEVKELLLLADPIFSKIELHLSESEIYIFQPNKNIIGVLVFNIQRNNILKL